MLGKILQLNKQLSDAFDARLPESLTDDGLVTLIDEIKVHIDDNDVRFVHDFGGGKNPIIGNYLPKQKTMHVTGLDIDKSELEAADPGTYDETVVADLSRPLAPKNISTLSDVSISAATVEHVPDSRILIKNMFDHMSKDATAFMFIPCKNAAFARLNMILPESVKKRLLKTFFPETGELQGFKAYYDNCTPKQIENVCREIGFKQITIKPSYNSFYFKFFAPLHILWRLLQFPAKLVFGSSVCETFVVIARK